MKLGVQFNLNGEPCEVYIGPHKSLLDVLRDELDMMGTKKGCNTGDCGACTVLIDGKAINSCLTLAVEVQGKDITTIEGIAKGQELHPIQRAFIEKGAVQCGYCTPGMILSAKALLDENPAPTDEQIKMAIAGNLCRCTGYVKIIEAIRTSAETMRK